MDELNVNRSKMNEKTADLFKVLDSDTNDLIDALEFLAAAALLSGMPTRDKLEFILNAYDFDGSQELSIDEVPPSHATQLLSGQHRRVAGHPRHEVDADGSL